MNQRKAKSLHRIALEYTKRNKGNFRTVYHQTKKLWNATPKILRHKLFS